jgi:hypothetical protein
MNVKVFKVFIYLYVRSLASERINTAIVMLIFTELKDVLHQ